MDGAFIATVRTITVLLALVGVVAVADEFAPADERSRAEVERPQPCKGSTVRCDFERYMKSGGVHGEFERYKHGGD